MFIQVVGYQEIWKRPLNVCLRRVPNNQGLKNLKQSNVWFWDKWNSISGTYDWFIQVAIEKWYLKFSESYKQYDYIWVSEVSSLWHVSSFVPVFFDVLSLWLENCLHSSLSDANKQNIIWSGEINIVFNSLWLIWSAAYAGWVSGECFWLCEISVLMRWGHFNFSANAHSHWRLE